MFARVAQAFGRFDHHQRQQCFRHRQPGVDYRYFDNLIDLARHVKMLVVAVPGRVETRGLISRDVIDALGPEGYFFNVSRGSTVDEPYLVDALVHRRLAGAGLDVFADEPRVPPALFALDHVVLQPHAGSGSTATRNALGQFVADNLAAHFAGNRWCRRSRAATAPGTRRRPAACAR